jgi:hypothetical protein
MKPICVPCKLFMRPEKNGIPFEEGLGDGTATSYKLWYGDLWKCRQCKNEVIVGTGMEPVAVRHHPGYMHERELHAPVLLVDDC